MGTPSNPKYKDIDSIITRLDPIEKCINYIKKNPPVKLYQSGIDRYKKIFKVGKQMVLFSDEMLKKYDRNYKPDFDWIPDDVEDLSDNLGKLNSDSSMVMLKYHKSIEFFDLQQFDDDKVMKQCAILFRFWFYERYSNLSVANTNFPEFHYRSTNIVNQIDKFIIACGYYIHKGQFLEFQQAVESWVYGIRDEFCSYHVPPEINRLCKNLKCCDDTLITTEALYIEKRLKPLLYHEHFFPENLNSISDFAVQRGFFEVIDESTRFKGLTEK